jgi:hypothetical protein
MAVRPRLTLALRGTTALCSFQDAATVLQTLARLIERERPS